MSAASRARQAERLRLTSGETPQQRYASVRTLAQRPRAALPGQVARGRALFGRMLRENARRQHEKSTRTAEGPISAGTAEGRP
ncbi:MAG: hypothetical protein HY323_07165 [Betaproteobacteria bacterium]|nr:hypothetical protein [Betaproteobacteria bacterium]